MQEDEVYSCIAAPSRCLVIRPAAQAGGLVFVPGAPGLTSTPPDPTGDNCLHVQRGFEKCLRFFSSPVGTVPAVSCGQGRCHLVAAVRRAAEAQ
jgi:hypothetical protein